MTKLTLCTAMLVAFFNAGSPAARAADTGTQPKAVPAPPVRLTTLPTRQQTFVYTTTRERDLKLQLFSPAAVKVTDQRAAIIFFHGAGAEGLRAEQFYPQAEYFASRGLVCASVNYPVIREGTAIVRTEESVAQAKSAMRWLRTHAAELGIDPKKIVAAGGSWGGMLALSTVLVAGLDAAEDDKAVPCEPQALILFNPSYGYRGLVQRKDTPPAIYFFGTNDTLNERAPAFIARSKELGNRTQYFTAKDQPHGFFNGEPWLTATTREADRFLVSLGYLSGVATLPPSKATLDLVK